MSSCVRKNNTGQGRLFLLPSEDERDLELYRSHLTDADEFFLQYGFRLDDEILNIIDFHSTNVCYYTVFLKATVEMAGYIGINPFKKSDNIGELEFHIFKEHRLRGYCVEAASAYRSGNDRTVVFYSEEGIDEPSIYGELISCHDIAEACFGVNGMESPPYPDNTATESI